MYYRRHESLYRPRRWREEEPRGFRRCSGEDIGAKYKLYLPTEEELRAELERGRELVERQLLDEAGDSESV
jgi:hypothetical protein